MIIGNIRDLESKVRIVHKELGYSSESTKSLLIVARKLIGLHVEQGMEQLDNGIVADSVAQKELYYKNGEITRKTFITFRTSMEYLVQIYNTGTLVKQPKRIVLSDFFDSILSDILSNENWNQKFRKHQYDLSILFLRWLYIHGHTDLHSVDEHVVREYLTDCSARMMGSSLAETRRVLKVLFEFLPPNGTLPDQMSRLFSIKIPVEKKIKPFMSRDDIAAVLSVIDRNTSKGKRDYAIILLGVVTGLRAIDVSELSFGSIDWRNGEILIIQEKTKKALALPLTSDVGEAICEYIIAARPKIKSDKIFLRVKAPMTAIQRELPNSILKEYGIKAGLQKHHGFHSLRRSVATNMITSGVSLITVAQILGHREIDSTKQYISLDSQNLKKCALDFSGIRIGGDAL